MGDERLERAREPDREDRRLLAELRGAAASGDRQTLDRVYEAIWHRHVATVSLVCARYLSDDGDVISATDDVFLRFFRVAPTLTLTVPLRAYLSVMAKHAALDILRAAARRSVHLTEPPLSGGIADGGADPMDRIPDADADVGASVRYRELVADLRAVLDPQAVEIILAHAVRGETFGEIGARLHLKENTVKTQYHRALKTYRRKKGDDLP